MAQQKDGTLNLGGGGSHGSFDLVADKVRGLGCSTAHTFFKPSRPLSTTEIDALYCDAIGARVIDLPVDGAFSEWPTLDGDPLWRNVFDRAEARVTELKLPAVFNRCAKLAMRDGSCYQAFGYEDQCHGDRAPWGRVPLLWVAPLWARDTLPMRLYGPGSPRFRQASRVRNSMVRPAVETDTAIGWLPALGEIHGTRFVRHHTDDGRSVYDRMAMHLANLLASESGAATLLDRASILWIQVKDWNAKIMQGDTQQVEAVQAQFEQLANNRALVTNEFDKLNQFSHGALGGVEGTVYALSWLVAAAAGIPMTKFFGMSPGGFSGGETEQQDWDDRLQNMRKRAEPLIRDSYDHVLAEVLGNPEIPHYDLSWPALRPPTYDESANVATAMMGAAKLALEIGVTDQHRIAEGMRQSGLEMWEWYAPGGDADTAQHEEFPRLREPDAAATLGTAAELAREFECAPSYIKRLAREGKIGVRPRTGSRGSHQYSREDLEAHIAQLT